MKKMASLAAVTFLIFATVSMISRADSDAFQVTDDLAQGITENSDSGVLPGDELFTRAHYTVCYARNVRDQIFRSEGYIHTALDQKLIQEKAMRQCKAFSLHCQAMGCKTF